MEKEIRNFREKIGEVFPLLTPREQKVLLLRFGLDDGILRTLEETAKEFGVTRERIRQIEAKALEKIRKYKLEENKKIEKIEEPERIELSNDFYIFSCPHCRKRIILDEIKWISKEDIDLPEGKLKKVGEN